MQPSLLNGHRKLVLIPDHSGKLAGGQGFPGRHWSDVRNLQGGSQLGGEDQAGPSAAKGKKKAKAAGAGGAAKKPAAKRGAGAKPAGGAKKKPSAKPGAKGKGGK